MPEFKLPQIGLSELADRIREAIGAGAWEEIRVMTPQFERTDGDPPWWHPQSAADLDHVKNAPGSVLRSLGLRPWNDPVDPSDKSFTERVGGVLWLFPSEWYEHIPAGYEIVDISGDRELFVPGETDDDMRFGCLAYGFVLAAREEAHDAE